MGLCASALQGVFYWVQKSNEESPFSRLLDSGVLSGGKQSTEKWNMLVVSAAEHLSKSLFLLVNQL
jgi:hypothetical protein